MGWIYKTLLVVVGQLVLGEILLRIALAHYARLSEGLSPAERYRRGLRRMYPAAFMTLPAFILCVSFIFPAGRQVTQGWVQLVLLLVSGLILLPAAAVLPFYRYKRSAGGPGLSGRAVASAFVRNVTFQALVYLLSIGGPVFALYISAKFLSDFGGLATFGFVIAIGFGMSFLTFITFPLMIKRVHRGRRLGGDLREELSRLERISGIKIEELYRVESPDQEANAMVSGLLAGRRFIFITDTLIEKATSDEIVAIVAHELAHIKHRHLLKNLALSLPGILLMAGLMFAGWKFRRWIGLEDGPILIVSTAILAWLIVSVMLHLPSSRSHEREADITASTWVGIEPYRRALTRLYEINLSGGNDSGFEKLLASHPSLLARLTSLPEGAGRKGKSRRMGKKTGDVNVA